MLHILAHILLNFSRSVRSPPDLLYFVPYTWKFHFSLKEFELLTLANEFNWIDTSSTHQENSLLAICGETLDLKFGLPYTEFLPNIIPFIFDIEVRSISLKTILKDSECFALSIWYHAQILNLHGSDF